MDKDFCDLLEPFISTRVEAIECAALKEEGVSKLWGEYVEQLERLKQCGELDSLFHTSADYYGAVYRRVYTYGMRDGLCLLTQMMVLPIPEAERPLPQ